MKLFSSELGHNYETYTFGYANYCEREESDSLTELYAAGYLPYSGSPDAKGIFYLARSARVLLKNFELTSENRRIAKKFDGEFKKKRIPFKEFQLDEKFYMFCLEYFKKRHGGQVMPRERLELILNSGIILTIVAYRSGQKIVAYVFEVADNAIGHYWYSFYDLSLVQQSLGMWLMLDCVRDAKARGLTHYYLGTVYGGKTLYKINFEPLEWWNGQRWSGDIKLLRERGRTDDTRLVPLMDAWKKEKNCFDAGERS